MSIPNQWDCSLWRNHWAGDFEKHDHLIDAEHMMIDLFKFRPFPSSHGISVTRGSWLSWFGPLYQFYHNHCDSQKCLVILNMNIWWLSRNTWKCPSQNDLVWNMFNHHPWISYIMSYITSSLNFHPKVPDNHPFSEGLVHQENDWPLTPGEATRPGSSLEGPRSTGRSSP